MGTSRNPVGAVANRDLPALRSPLAALAFAKPLRRSKVGGRRSVAAGSGSYRGKKNPGNHESRKENGFQDVPLDRKDKKSKQKNIFFWLPQTGGRALSF